MSFVVYLPHVVGSREMRRAYDVGSIQSVVSYDGNNTKYDIALNLHDDHQQWLSAYNAMRLWREWKRHHRCQTAACYMRRQSDTPGACTFCQLADELEANGYKVLPELPRFQVTPIHYVVLTLALASSLLTWNQVRMARAGQMSAQIRVGVVSPLLSAKAVQKTPINKVLVQNGRKRGGHSK